MAFSQKPKSSQSTLQQYLLRQTQKPPEKKSTHEEELALALKLSQREHIAEQQRILSRLKKGKQAVRSRPISFPQRHDSEEEDAFFQTVSTRKPPTNPYKRPKANKVVKKEKEEEEEEEQLVIDDVSEWLDVKQEKNEEEEQFVIDNVASWLEDGDDKEDAESKKNTEDVVIKLKTEKEEEEEDEQLEIEDLSTWLDDEEEEAPKNKESGSESTNKPKKPRRVRCYICNQLFERSDIRMHTSSCSLNDNGDTEPMTTTLPSSTLPFSTNNRNRYHNQNHDQTDNHHVSNNTHTRNESPFPSHNDTGKQECPLCFKLFDIDEIERHSANCNLKEDDMLVDDFNDASTSDIFHITEEEEDDDTPNTGTYEFNMERQVYDVGSADEDGSECSFIDMSSSQFNEASLIPQQEEDDGYLSPLEGHVNILENREQYQHFFNQFPQESSTSTRKPRKPRKTAARKSTPEKRANYFKRLNSRGGYRRKNGGGSSKRKK